MVNVSFSRDFENRTISIENYTDENSVNENVTDILAKLIADWAIDTGVVVLNNH